MRLVERAISRKRKVLTSSINKTFRIPSEASRGRVQVSGDKSKRRALFMSYSTWTIFVISCISITPLPSTSYIRNAHFSFSSGVPLDVTSIANRNSCNKGRREGISDAVGGRATMSKLLFPPPAWGIYLLCDGRSMKIYIPETYLGYACRSEPLSDAIIQAPIPFTGAPRTRREMYL